MNTTMTDKKWSELRSKIQAKWSKFNDADLESFRADLSLISNRIQLVYGIAKDHAVRQYQEFERSIQSMMGPELVAVPIQEEQTVAPAAAAPSAPVEPPVVSPEPLTAVKAG